jgi:hypothetical protein
MSSKRIPRQINAKWQLSDPKRQTFLKTNQTYTCRPEMGPNQTKLKLHKNQNFAVSKPKISNKDHVLITLPLLGFSLSQGS